MRHFLSSAVRIAFYLLLAVMAFVLVCNIWVVRSTSKLVFTDYEALPDHQVGLVLGTSNRLTDGSPNPFFDDRIKTAALLYKQGKVSHFILSGDNRTRYYNEPNEMKKALTELGVPAQSITLDYAGLRTLDSIVRSNEIFGQENVTIITQNFHCYRALFISNYYHLHAIAFVADESREHTPMSVYWREYFARTKAVLDLYVLKTKPRHLGEKEPIER